ncbi:MAG TPA: GAF domain-containing sensor histidine kinase, partial [Candidatus Dormibacteraeota bacterium]|nr:GAF domain-containing sensor histidine kinase [Candidatus Dormibacteraeota bacterium]
NATIAFDAATVFLLEDGGRELKVKAAIGVPVSLAELTSFKVGEGVVGWVVQHATTALIANSAVDARYKSTGPARPARTVLAAPLRTATGVLGALVLVRPVAEPFGPDHQRLVEAVAGQAAVAIEHSRLFETERASRRRAEALLEAAQACSEAVTVPELLQRAVKRVAVTMRARGAAIFLPDEDLATIAGVFEGGDEPTSILQGLVKQRIDAFPLGRALRDAHDPIVVDAADRRDLIPEGVWSRLAARQLAIVPIRWQDQLLAAMVVGFAPGADAGPAEVELLNEVGRQVALGMERLRLQGRVQEQVNQMAVVGERNRIARDLHDGIVQYVYALGLNLEHARDLLQADPPAAATILTQSVEQVNHVLSEMRTFIYQLRPIIMREKEIGQWIADLCLQFQQATAIDVVTEIGKTGGRELSPEISIALFRIIQETLANIYKHASAHTATLLLEFQPEGVRLRIADDGIGFDPARRGAPEIGRGHGLANIEERVRDLNGTVSVDSAPGHGSRLEAVIPYR